MRRESCWVQGPCEERFESAARLEHFAYGAQLGSLLVVGEQRAGQPAPVDRARVA
jgi:hypothetical protein